MHVLLTRPYSQNSSLKMFRESSLVHISYTKTSSLTFSILQPMHSFDKLHDMGYFMIVHTQPFFIYQPSYHQIANKVAICQTNSIMTLVLKQKVLFDSLIIKLSKLLLFYTYVDQMKIQQRFDVFVQLQIYNIFTNILSIIFKCFF